MSTAASGALLSAEVRKFDSLAHEFWDPRGAFHPLHALNPVRLGFIARATALAGRRVLDVGCGGGLLAESLAQAGASVTAIDLAPAMLEVARLHAHESALSIDYQLCSAEQYAARGPAPFDVVTCMELIEHVPDPAALLRPGGAFIGATLNRTPQSYALAIVGAEYVMRLIPRGTHEYERLLRPSELARLARASGLMLREVAGIAYDPFARTARLNTDPRVNYLAHFRREPVPVQP